MRYKILGFDTEDDGKGNFQGGCTFDMETEKVRYFREARAMRRFLESPYLEGYILFAHNAEYDITNIWGLKNLKKFSYYAKSGSLFKLAVLNHGHKARTLVMDSFGHFQGSLKKIGDAIGLPKMEDPGLDAPWDVRRDYCARDAEIVARFIGGLQEAYIELGTSLHPSAGGSAMELFQRKYLDISWYAIPRSLWFYMLSGYHGGRAESFRWGKIPGPVYCYDVNSLYPYIATQEQFPHPGRLVFKKDPRPSCLDYPGITRCTVEVEGDFPPLPVKRERLIFPEGVFSGTWPNNLLRHAQTAGAKILKIHSTCISQEEDYYLRAFMLDLYELRKTHPNPMLRMAAKWILNALTGKFGQKDRTTRYDAPSESFVSETTQPPVYSVPAWSAIITGGGIAHMQPLFDEHTCYTATDSIHSTRKYPENPEELGGLKLEKVYRKYELKGLAHAGNLPDGTREYTVRGAAVRAMREDGGFFSPAGEAFETGATAWRKPLKMVEARKRGMRANEWVERPFTLKEEDNKRERVKGGKTVPLQLYE